jgi:hypothetical protein
MSVDLYGWIKAFHIIAVIAWMAGMLYLPRLFVYHCAAEKGSVQSETFKVMERRLVDPTAFNIVTLRYSGLEVRKGDVQETKTPLVALGPEIQVDKDFCETAILASYFLRWRALLRRWFWPAQPLVNILSQPCQFSFPTADLVGELNRTDCAFRWCVIAYR